ncbi:DUF2971 domain-containing protein [Pedobacter hiemivivus]|uniref:DUF2971 domain-containing protein n=1 Tax=Pedobacter hiemivivus TaxID=2530454 RepID=A0A4U1GDN5_9SPHI|nr:DUF2971 domain-containing protein [Pedobacter hiemivivus]TKC62147.1 DUF2971 domain-containing protein [Pedobacter hiemivivus]
MILYKYRGNSHFTDSILTEKKVWLANATTLNDPFECTIQEIAKEFIEEQIEQMKMGHVMGFLQSALTSIKNKTDFYGLTPKQTKEYLGKLKARKTIAEQHRASREFIHRKTGNYTSDPEKTYANFDNQLNDVGIFSLTEDPENQLMWAHYAEQSKGIALGFEVTENSKLASKTNCLKVNYSDELPAFSGEGFLIESSIVRRGTNTQKIVFHDPTMQAAISTKPSCWNYEKEWRYVEELAGSYAYPGKLRELVFGLKCPDSKRKEYIDLLKSSGHTEIELFEIIILQNSNQIRKSKLELI